jgi:hypothetical protein
MTSIGSTLAPGQKLLDGQRLVSDNGNYYLDIGMDQGKNMHGYLYLWLAGNDPTGTPYKQIEGKAGTFSQPQALPFLCNQLDGNLVLYAPKYASDTSSEVVDIIVLWASNTEVVNGGSQNRLVMQEDGNLVLYNPANVAVWATHTPAPTRFESLIDCIFLS